MMNDHLKPEEQGMKNAGCGSTWLTKSCKYSQNSSLFMYPESETVQTAPIGPLSSNFGFIRFRLKISIGRM